MGSERAKGVPTPYICSVNIQKTGRLWENDRNHEERRQEGRETGSPRVGDLIRVEHGQGRLKHGPIYAKLY
jgi:hypothetical protein